MSKLKVGAIGCGFISGAHIKGWKNIEHVEVAAVCDIDKNRAEKRAKEFGVDKIYTDGRPYYGNITQRVSFAIPVGKERKIAL